MDTIGNMLSAITNGGLVKKSSVTVPASKLKLSILSLLKQEGYIKTYHVNGDAKPVIEIVLEYVKGSPRIQGTSRVSKLSKRVYIGVKDITPVKYGQGIAVLSTPKGILTDKQARKELVGGELLFTIW